MKLLAIFIIIFTIISCNYSSRRLHDRSTKSIHIPDTINNFYATIFDYPYYVRKKGITQQLKLSNLENDSSSIEIRIWTLASNYNPQRIYTLKNKNCIWTISSLKYYISFSNWKNPKVDSILLQEVNEKNISSDELKELNPERIWSLPSQSEMRNGSSYGCNDGYALLIEMNSKEKYKYSFYMCPDFHTADDSTFRIVDSFMRKADNISYRHLTISK